MITERLAGVRAHGQRRLRTVGGATCPHPPGPPVALGRDREARPPSGREASTALSRCPPHPSRGESLGASLQSWPDIGPCPTRHEAPAWEVGRV